MTFDEIQALVEKYESEFDPNSYRRFFGETQFDDRSARINYAMVREHKPKVVLEFGSRYGRCTHDILLALLKNGGEYNFQSYEIEDRPRDAANNAMRQEFGDKGIVIGKDVMQGNLPNNIEYLFLDHGHDEPMNHWVLEELIPKHCKDGCLVQIHDLPIHDDWVIEPNPWNEASLLKDYHVAGKLFLKKVYWTYEEGNKMESTWWTYQK